MDTVEAPAEGTSADPAPTPTAIDAADAIVLNVLSPSNEVPGGRITFPRIHLDTKLSQLKARIRNAMQAAPLPERQRLIYRGHALLNGDLTLRQVLRPQGSAEAHTDAYTLHLVLPPGNASSSPLPPQVAASTTETTGLPPPPIQPTIPNGLPQMPGVQLPQQVLAQAQAAQMMLQNQLNMLQQQLGGHNHQHAHGHAQAHPQQIPGMTGVNMMPNGMQVTYQIHHGQPFHQGPNLPTPPGFGFGLPNAANFQAMMNQQQQMPHPAVAGHHPTPTPGHAAADQPDVLLQNIRDQNGTPPANNTEGAGPTPTGQPPMVTRVQETVGPQGQRIRTVVRESVNMTISRHGTPLPPSRPASTDPAGAQTQRQAQAPMQPHIHTHHVNTQPTRHSPMPFIMPSPMPTAPSTTTAWLLSSPNGPEALLFAPGHGYFSSASIHPSVGLGPTRTNRHRSPADITALSGAAQPAGGRAPAQPGQLAVQPLPRQPHPNAIPAAQLPEENENLNFIVGRAWLFLRLYVFTFFISQPNTWQRYALLAIATFICFLPRDNFLQRGMTQVRRHIDALIGPPAAPARDGAAAPAPPNAGAGAGAAPGAAQPAANMTPAETAARLVREHEARNPSMVRDVLFRVERAIAMFLASLVPGVGERHVRAREDQRREAERVENERRARDEAEGAQVQVDAIPIGGAETGSTALDTRDDGGEVRERTTQPQAVEAGA